MQVAGDGIQKLLAAESSAAQIVAEARKVCSSSAPSGVDTQRAQRAPWAMQLAHAIPKRPWASARRMPACRHACTACPAAHGQCIPHTRRCTRASTTGQVGPPAASQGRGGARDRGLQGRAGGRLPEKAGRGEGRPNGGGPAAPAASGRRAPSMSGRAAKPWLRRRLAACCCCCCCLWWWWWWWWWW